MAFEVVKAEIASLVARINSQPHDKLELQVMLREKLNELRAFGMPVPQDLAELEVALDQEFSGRIKAPDTTT